MRYNDLPHLPVREILPELQASFVNHRSVVLAAEPGSGKTTIVPLVLLDEPWLAEKKIIMLEPRRLAARMAAERMSQLVADQVGGLVGYRIRFAGKVSSGTRIEVVTEGIFTRMIQNDPELTNVGLVIFDEFHVRSLEADLGLAFCLDMLELRDDLKIMIMSATMNTSRVSRFLDNAPVISGQGRCFPVTIKYLPRPSADFLVPLTVGAINRALSEHDGDILVFLPGAGEIKAVRKQISGNVLCLPLYGNLPQHKQDLIFAPAKQRRVILATPIAETSLTIEGVKIVIDSGMMKVPGFSPVSGLTTLKPVAISKASAKQRAGRAGRLGPGICYRLWTESEQYSRSDFLAPEIIGADLAPLLLQVLQWGVTDPHELHWLDPPRPGQVKQAREILAGLGAVDDKNHLTAIGKKLARLPLHPRLALMLLRGCEQGNGALACRLAALLQNRDLFRGNKTEQSVDIEDRLDILRLFERHGAARVQAKGADPSLCRRILREADQYQRLLGINEKAQNFQESGNLLAIAYPDRIAMKNPGSNRHRLSSGRGVALPVGDHLQHADFVVAANVDGGKKQGRVFLGAALDRQDIIADHSHLLAREEKVEWRDNRVVGATILRLGCLELTREPLSAVHPDKMRGCLLAGIRQEGLCCLNRTKKNLELQERMQYAHIQEPDKWPDVSDTGLINDLSWLAPYLEAINSLKQLKKLDFYSILHSLIDWRAQQRLDKLVPSHFQVPSGSRIKLSYQPGQPPVLAVRLQEMFGAIETPTVFAGKMPVLGHLLSPASRPIQVTRDLAGFWQNTYHEVKKELKGRYPKHYWPDDPLRAHAVRGVRRGKAR